ncbi:hypothetical protein [Candidatus Rhabdochlamydia sp. T3358]|uniref:hypothetical protein n=1 Tax=Candidatus Rhabdochlamydia sp. T3358 TaxID=2099795 RepID=UPI0010B228DE|nr:hypothetical protein [Candidatus Rhabdochlamydia sp. T3358]VHO02333.1 hypothetical protein RHT_00466 [Candidatus Rhabdochlamydia sp. T3358]
MIYLIPIPYNYSKIVSYDYSEMPMDPSAREEVKTWAKNKLANIDINTKDKQIVAATLVITTITSMAIAYLPKFIVLGCTIISAIAYIELAKMVEAKSGILKNILITQRIIEHLVDPNQKGQKLTEDLERIEAELKNLEEGSLENKKLFGEDLNPQHTENLKKDAEQIKANLESKLKSLEENLPYFQENSLLLTKLADVWQKIDRNNENRITACRDFMFYSLMGTSLINIDHLKELIGRNDYARYIMYPSLIIALGVISVVYAAKQVFSILAHRNDEVKKQALLATIENERESLLECFP